MPYDEYPHLRYPGVVSQVRICLAESLFLGEVNTISVLVDLFRKRNGFYLFAKRSFKFIFSPRFRRS